MFANRMSTTCSCTTTPASAAARRTAQTCATETQATTFRGVPSNDANAQRRTDTDTESACIGAHLCSTAKLKRKTETLFPANLMKLQHQFDLKQ
jgi:hypothetical protein